MVGIQGIGGAQEPRPDRPSSVRDNRSSQSADSEKASDGVVISSEAQAAAAVAKTIQLSAEQAQVRLERVEAAKQSLERGDYRSPDVVNVVAERINRLL
jgi:anti-sigma28 factor (negative regulator of flagellin synthesis)